MGHFFKGRIKFDEEWLFLFHYNERYDKVSTNKHKIL